MKKSSILLAAITILAACNKTETPAPVADTIIARIEQEAPSTKTYMDASNNIRWSSGDQVVAFMKTSLGLRYQIKEEYIGKASGYFSQVSSGSSTDLGAGTEWDHNVVYYPYSAAVEAEKSGSNYTLDVVLPAEQTYAPESFGEGSMAMVAVSEDNNITFRNILGGMKLQLKGTQVVTSITLQGKNNEKLSGAATVTAYPDETKPAITMASDASTLVTLNCGSGVQLNESTATEFIIALPPVLFSQGFTITVTDSDSKTYTVETDKANTVLRSSLLTMPAFKLGEDPSEEQPEDDETTIPVSKITFSKTSLTLPINFSYTLTAKVTPIDATDQSLTWSSDNASVAKVDQSGVLTTLSLGTANITAEAGGVSETCKITVIVPTTKEPIDYKVGDVSYGKGVVIGDVVWAPVNCGYEPATSVSKGFPYGKLYQWGRKYGQGYSTSYDESVPEVTEGPISVINGQEDKYANVFFTVSESPRDWISPKNDELWNSGTEENPIKTEYDPCPEGWRVPTYAELEDLIENRSSWLAIDGQEGLCFSGHYSYIENIPQVFFPAAGGRYFYDGRAISRSDNGYYWSSRPTSTSAYYLYFYSSPILRSNYRADGYSVRCVQE